MSTRGHSVAHELRDLVLDGAFQPGARLTELELSEQLGVSRTPVRNALSMLAAEGLVEHAPNSGFRVRRFSVRDVEGVYDCRAVLEGLAARSVAEAGLADTERGLLHRNLSEAERLRRGTVWDETARDRWARLNEEFHETIFRAADNPYLGELITRTRAVPQLRRIKFLWHDMEVMVASSIEHEEMFEAITAGQGARAEHLAREHVYRAGRRLADNWRRAEAHEAKRAPEDARA